MYGSHITAYELGQMIIKDKGLALEDLVSKHGFKRLGVANPLDCQRRAEKGDKKAIAIYNQIGAHLGIGLANLANIFDPEMIIIGGGIGRAGNLLLAPAKKEMKKHTKSSLKKLPLVRMSKLEHAGALGAVSLFFR
jgi:glucokinase